MKKILITALVSCLTLSQTYAEKTTWGDVGAHIGGVTLLGSGLIVAAAPTYRKRWMKTDYVPLKTYDLPRFNFQDEIKPMGPIREDLESIFSMYKFKGEKPKLAVSFKEPPMSFRRILKGHPMIMTLKVDLKDPPQAQALKSTANIAKFWHRFSAEGKMTLSYTLRRFNRAALVQTVIGACMVAGGGLLIWASVPKKD